MQFTSLSQCRWTIIRLCSFVVALTAATSAAVAGNLKLSTMFADHAVLQCGMPVPVWGWAKPGATVKVRFAGQSVRTIAKPDGDWAIKLAPLAVDDDPQIMTVSSGSQHIKLTDILVGEVWLCSGQSNMQYNMAGWFHRTNLLPLLKRANHPHIRLYHVPMIAQNFSGSPKKNAPATWQLCTPKNVAGFSAVGYLFGRELHNKLHVPVGLIESDWGGTHIEAWTPASGFASLPALKRTRQWLTTEMAHQRTLDNAYHDALNRWIKAAAGTKTQGHALPKKPAAPIDLIAAPHAYNYHIPPKDWQPDPHQNPTTLFNGMIAPLIPYAIRGAIWYQGENNVGSHDTHYFENLEALVDSWRSLWHEGNFPFYIVQIAPFNYGRDARWEPYIWRGEEQAAMQLPNSGIASTMDIGNTHNIHPADKLDVARRLALIALAKTYARRRLIYSGPVFKYVRFAKGRAIISFAHVDGGLASRNDKALNWFEIAGANGKFVSAQAKISGRGVVVASPDVLHPKFVRFAWSDVAVPNLMNKAGLPALPFNTAVVPWKQQ
ncbi:MAG: sialate O-acetylesterase [Phycisphaerae bacterium]